MQRQLVKRMLFYLPAGSRLNLLVILFLVSIGNCFGQSFDINEHVYKDEKFVGSIYKWYQSDAHSFDKIVIGKKYFVLISTQQNRVGVFDIHTREQLHEFELKEKFNLLNKQYKDIKSVFDPFLQQVSFIDSNTFVLGPFEKVGAYIIAVKVTVSHTNISLHEISLFPKEGTYAGIPFYRKKYSYLVSSYEFLPEEKIKVRYLSIKSFDKKSDHSFQNVIAEFSKDSQPDILYKGKKVKFPQHENAYSYHGEYVYTHLNKNEIYFHNFIDTNIVNLPSIQKSINFRTLIYDNINEIFWFLAGYLDANSKQQTFELYQLHDFKLSYYTTIKNEVFVDIQPKCIVGETLYFLQRSDTKHQKSLTIYATNFSNP